MGKLVVMEGLDGSGKATQTKLLSAYWHGKGVKHQQISFPNYEENSSALIKMYLAGELGALDWVNVYAASSFYAVDRYASFVRHWREYYREGGIILSDRYTTSNACHQMGKLPRAQWEDYLQWLEEYEYERLCLPRPDLVVYLDMPVNLSQQMIEQRQRRESRPKDIHEADVEYLKQCRRAGLFAAERLGWHTIECGKGSFPYAHELIAEQVTGLADTILLQT